MKNLITVILFVVIAGCSKMDVAPIVPTHDVLFTDNQPCLVQWGVNGYQNSEQSIGVFEMEMKIKEGDTLKINIGETDQYKTTIVYQDGFKIREAYGNGYKLIRVITPNK